MCGIAGWFDASASTDEDVIESQLQLLLHRGPDSFGFHRGTQATVGQTRLAIIDLVTGDPPIANEDGSIGVALNGEIYNFAELRKELLHRGHHLSTQGDTEVIAHLAEDDDAIGLARSLEGMFAFAVWDERAKKLTLGRDRVGKKPLYYWTDGSRLVFASEIKALLVHPLVPSSLNEAAIPAYLTFGYVPTPQTFFEGIYSVPPGHVLEMQEGGGPRIRPYWAPPLPSPGDHLDLSLEEAAAETRVLLRRAVERRLISDVPLGAFLSGGIDSSAVVAYMARASDRPVRTFTIGFEDAKGYDERAHARSIADRFRTDHTEFVVRPDAVDLLETLVDFFDQPFADSSAIPTYLLSEVTRQHVTVALAGDGGDEIFAGYERFRAAANLGTYMRLPSAVRRGFARGAGLLDREALRGRVGSVQRFASAAEQGLPDAYAEWVGLTSRRSRDELGVGSLKPLHEYRALWERSEGAEVLDRLLDLNLRTYLVDDLLVKVDRASMAHGLEVRAPFLDRELMEFALRLPVSFRIQGWTLKRVLKRALSTELPRDVLNRRKRGFGVPLDRWFRSDLKTYLGSVLGPGAAIRRHLNGDGLDRVMKQHQASAADHGQLLWGLLMLEVFLRSRKW